MVEYTIRGYEFTFPDNLSDDVKAAIREGRYEGDEITAIKKYIGDVDVIEIGAGFGVTTHFIAKNISKRVVALEPQRSLARYAIKNADRGRVCICRNAYSPLAKSSTKLNIYDEEWSATTGDIEKDKPVIDTAPVSTLSLQDIRDRYMIDEFILVCDAEGAEYMMLQQESDILRENCKLAIMEFHPELGGPAERLINKHGFDIIDRINDIYVISP